MSAKRFYVYSNGASCFVKDGDYFEEQGGLTADWGKSWKMLHADSIEHARQLAEKHFEINNRPKWL